MKIFNTIIRITLMASLCFSIQVQADIIDNLKQMVTKESPPPEPAPKESKLTQFLNSDSIQKLKTGKFDATALVQDLVREQCRGQINKRKEWQAISFFMSESKKRQTETKACDCVTRESLKTMSTEDALNIVNPNTRSKTINKVTMTVVKSCLSSKLD